MATLEESIRQFLNAPLAPGKPSLNTLIGLAVAGHLHANFDRAAGGQNVDSSKPDKRKPRILRPGAIILPNLDIDEDPAVDRKRFTKDQLDAIGDDKVNDGDDVNDLTSFKIAEPASKPGDAVKIIMKVDAKDAERVRIWEIPKGKTAQEGIVRIGPTKTEHVVVDISGFTLFPPRGWEDEFIIEALTLAGDPKLPAPSGKAPTAPGKHRTPLPDTSGGSQLNPTVNNNDPAKSIYDSEKRLDDPAKPEARAVGDVWIELVHENKGGAVADLKDIGLFTIAPWLMTWNTLDCQRIYVVSMGASGVMGSANDARFDNHGMVWDLQLGCSAAGLGPAPDTDTTKLIPTNRPKEIKNPNDVPFYVIDGTKFRFDRWIQDEIEIGYCFAPHHWLHIVLHAKRRDGLVDWVNKEMAHARLGVFNGISGTAKDGQDFGGNLEVSPPVAKKTPALPRDVGGLVAGPTCKEHDRPAPFGKIIMGDCTPRPCHDETRGFLLAQKVQPVLPVDTSWLIVGHVDEFLSFVRANDAKKFKLLLASVRAMTLMLREVLNADPAATMHAGKYEIPGRSWIYDEHFVDDWLNALNNVRTYSEKVEREKMNPIRDRLKTGLDIEDKDILPIPTYFTPPRDPAAAFGDRGNRTIARNVGSVNMQIANNHLMVPRPFGPRLEPAKAKTVVEELLKKVFASGQPAVPSAIMPASGSFHFWARPGETLRQIARYFARPAPATGHDAKEPRKQLIAQVKNNSAALHADYNAALNKLVVDISTHSDNTGAPTPIDKVAPPPLRRFTKWMRITIPQDTIDVVEAYLKSILEGIGNTVHFIDDFECYHAMFGEVHCGTNAKRKPPEEDAAFKARWWDPGVYDPDFDTSYEPGN